MASQANARSDEVTEECLERALVFLAYLVTRKGPGLVPIFERLEHELEDIRKRRGAVDRARLLLESYTVDGGLKAIC